MAKGHKFGTFGGVFTPSILTILGVIMYMRLPWIVGNAGLWMTIGIILVAHVISITTGLSVASIATDKNVQAGGPYYIVSRSLGLPLGGTLGLGLAVGLSFSISLYIIGFTESLLSFLGRDVSLENIRLWGTGTLVALTAITLISTALAIKTQYLILAFIAASLVSIFAGPDDTILYGIGPITADAPHLNPRPDAEPIAALFGVFFPAVTGFTAGVNMSGDLKDPRRAIPTGTLAAIFVGMAVYLALAVLLALRIDPNVLVQDPDALLKFAAWPEAVIAGIWGATLSSALGSILGAPRILQALSLDRITPRVFARGHGKTNEPRYALILCVVIAEAGILIGELNAIAAIVSMFFIATYGFLNMSCAIESWASADFRPDFRIPRWISVLGAVACGFIMMQLGVLAMMGALVLLAAVFLWLKRRELTLESGDTWAGVWSSVVRTGLTRLDTTDDSERNWRPNIVAFSAENTQRFALLRFGQALLGRRGVLTEFALHGPETPPPTPASEAGQGVFFRAIRTTEPFAELRHICQHYGFSGVEPNTVLADFNEHVDTGGIGQLLSTARGRDMSVMLLAHDHGRGFGNRGRVDLWSGAGFGSLRQNLTLLRFLSASDDWHRATTRLVLLTRDASEVERQHKRAQKLLTEARLDADIKVVTLGRDEHPEVRCRTESAGADLVILGLPRDVDASWVDRAKVTCATLGTLAFVRPSSRLDAGEPTRESARPTTPVELPAVPEAIAELRLPPQTECASQAETFAREHREVLYRFEERWLRPAYERDAAAIVAARQLVKRYFGQLEKTLSAPVHPRQSKALARAQSALLFQAHKLISELGQDHLTQQAEALEAGIENTNTSLGELEAGHAETLRVHPGAAAFAPAPDDSRAVRRLKRSRRAIAGLTRSEPVYDVPLRALAQHYVGQRSAEAILNATRAFGIRSHATVVDLGKRLASLRASLTLVAAHLNDDARLDILVQEREQILERLDELAAQHTAHIRRERAELVRAVHAIHQGYADDLARLDIAHLVRTARRPPRTAVLGPELAETWRQNHSLVVSRAAVAVLIASLQQRIATIVRRTRSALTLSLQNTVIREYTRFNESLRSYLAQPVPPVLQLDLRPRDTGAVLDDLSREIDAALEELPESLETTTDEAIAQLADDPFEEAERLIVPARRLIRFLIDGELLGRLREELGRQFRAVERASDVGQDVIRLISFNLADLEGADEPLDDEARVQLTPVVESGRRRVETELEQLEALPTQLTEYVEGRLEVVLDRTGAYAVTGSAEQLQRGLQQGTMLSGVDRAARHVASAARAVLARVVYNRSEGVLLARRLRTAPNDPTTLVPRVRALVADHMPSPQVAKALPFYYQQLFLGKTALGDGLWIGREETANDAAAYIAEHRRGAGGALFVLGEPAAGKATFCNHLAHKHFDKSRIHHIRPPAGGSIDPTEFHQRLEAAAGVFGTPQRIFQTLPTGSVIVVHSLERWWERSADGMAVVDELLELIEAWGDRCLFIVSMTAPTFRLASRVRPLGDAALGVLSCGPLSAQNIKDIILLRHRSTGLRFQLGGRGHDQLPEWRFAQLFNAHFAYSGGLVGDALQSWITHIDAVDGEMLRIRTPRPRRAQVLGELRMEWTAILLELLVHGPVSQSRLERITDQPSHHLTRDLGTLERMGLLVRDREVIGINRYLRHLVYEHMTERGLLP